MQGWPAREAVFQPREAVCVKAQDVAGNLAGNWEPWRMATEEGKRDQVQKVLERSQGPNTKGSASSLKGLMRCG